MTVKPVLFKCFNWDVNFPGNWITILGFSNGSYFLKNQITLEFLVSKVTI